MFPRTSIVRNARVTSSIHRQRYEYPGDDKECRRIDRPRFRTFRSRGTTRIDVEDRRLADAADPWNAARNKHRIREFRSRIWRTSGTAFARLAPLAACSRLARATLT